MLAITTATLAASFVPGFSGASVRVHTSVTWTQQYFTRGSDGLYEISCPTATDCVAVGDEAASTTNGGRSWSRWADVRATGQFDTISCPSTTFCMATGGFESILEEGDSVFTSTTLGRSWHEVGLDGNNPAATLSCASEALCFDLSFGSLTESKDGGRQWSDVALPLPASTNSDAPTWVSCPSASDCFVSGTAGPSSGTSSEVVVWKLQGASFQIALARTSSASSAFISCTKAGVCGAASTGEPSNTYFLTSNDGKSWASDAMPKYAQDLQAVSCAGSTCTVLSTRGDGTPLRSSTTSDGGTSWSQSTLATNSADGAYSYYPLTSLSCPTAILCYADGWIGPSVTGIVHVHVGTASSWSSQPAASGPLPLQGVTCATTSLCVAVGGSQALRSVNGGVAWSASSTGLSPASSLRAVACPNAITCVAVGATGTKGVEYRSVDGGAKWHSVSLPKGTSGLVGVSCTSGFCVALERSSTGILVSTNLGAGWTYRPFPSAWKDPELTSVSCSSGGCVAVGSLSPQADALDVVINDDGTDWSLNSFSTFFYPTSVNCTSALRCWSDAIAMFEGPGTEVPGVLETTDGGVAWTLVGEPGVAGTPAIAACNVAICQAVGSSWPTSPFSDTLATSTDGGSSWTRDKAPAAMQEIIAITECGARWIGVGQNDFDGPEVITAS